MFLVSSCSCLCAIHWSHVLSREWRCSWSSADRRCSNYICMVNNFITYGCACYIRDLMVHCQPVVATVVADVLQDVWLTIPCNHAAFLLHLHKTIKCNHSSLMTYPCSNEQGKSEGFDSCDRPSNLKLDSNRQFFCLCDSEIWWMTLQNNRAPLLCYFKLCASYHWWIQTWVTVRNAQFGSKSTIFWAVWPRNFTDDPQKQ